ncbi:MAG: hypothetical protein IPJ06_05480 [Saprospiraceae bacterium]|nr:hypothetical protein [Saprospiraceae bacterium]
MKRLLAWLFLLLPMGGQSLWGQSTDRQAQINFLLNSEVLTAEDIASAQKDQPFLIDRWHLLSTAGWKTSTFPEGKGDPPYPVLTWISGRNTAHLILSYWDISTGPMIAFPDIGSAMPEPS